MNINRVLKAFSEISVFTYIVFNDQYSELSSFFSEQGLLIVRVLAKCTNSSTGSYSKEEQGLSSNLYNKKKKKKGRNPPQPMLTCKDNNF